MTHAIPGLYPLYPPALTIEAAPLARLRYLLARREVAISAAEESLPAIERDICTLLADEVLRL